MSLRGYEYLDHTADIGIRAWGPDLDAAFAEAAHALVADMVELDHARAVEERPLVVEADSLERLLFQFLDEVLFLFQSEQFVPVEIHAHLVGEKRLEARLRGEDYDAQRHGHVHEVKAITYHDLEVTRVPAQVRVVLDI